MFELAFFTGHYLGEDMFSINAILTFIRAEHVLPSCYRKFHLLHHTTKADTAVSGYYMTGELIVTRL